MTHADYILETSWEVCNKVGGIYTVLSTRAEEMVHQQQSSDKVLFVGPFFGEIPNEFEPITPSWASSLQATVGFSVQIGRWLIPGKPMAILVDFTALIPQRDKLYYEMWQQYGIDSSVGYGDYQEATLFSVAAAQVMIAFKRIVSPRQQVVAIFNEWTTGMGLLYCKLHESSIATIFITHATTVGRSIAGNGKPLYDQMSHYNGDGMATELHVVGKHALEKAAAHHADAFATVSEVTNVECRQLLEREADVVQNGFCTSVIPNTETLSSLRTKARTHIQTIIEMMYGVQLQQEPFIVSTSGRCEYRNKGLDVYINAIARYQGDRPLIALILVPSWAQAPRSEVLLGLDRRGVWSRATESPYLTHTLNAPNHNPIYTHLRSLEHLWGHGVYPLYVPTYLDGSDGVLGYKYYDLLPALDLTVFASYYEPWGYTPLESIAFGVSTITTDKSGFGLWAQKNKSENETIVLHRNDHNADELASEICEEMERQAQFIDQILAQQRKQASTLANKATWHHFYKAYLSLISKAITHNNQ